MKPLYRLTTYIATAGLLGTLTACTPTAQTTDSSGTLIIAMTASDIPMLDTTLSSNQGYEGARFVGRQLYDSLTAFDLSQGETNPKIVGDLATTWEIDEAAHSWTFHLRTGVTFHDGTPFDADAAVFNLRRYTDKTFEYYYPELAARAGLGIAGIDRVDKVDNMAIKIVTKGPWASLTSDLVSVLFGSPAEIKKDGNKGFAAHPVGTGPFKFSSLQPGQSLTLVANDQYWAGRPNLDTLILRPIPDPTARAAALRAGEVNWIETPLPDDVPGLKAAGYQVAMNSYDHNWPWIFNTTKAPFSDVRIRRALEYAVDRQSLIDNVLHGTAEPAAQGVAPANAAYRKDNDLYRYDPSKAKTLLAEAGHPNGLDVTLVYPTSGSGNMVPGPMNEALQQQLATLGINVKLVPVEWASMGADFVAGKFPQGADLVNISLGFQQEGYWNMLLGAAPQNLSGLHDPQAEALFTQARATFDDTKRFDLYAQAAHILTDQAQWLYIVHDLNPRVLAPTVHGFVDPKSWYVDLTKVTVGP
nr:ABC transporter substrate-binding protein [Dactylosporangium thailandense]